MLLAPASRGGDILRGGATVDRNRKNADARGRAGAETADSEPSHALADFCLVAMNTNEFLYLE